MGCSSSTATEPAGPGAVDEGGSRKANTPSTRPPPLLAIIPGQVPVVLHDGPSAAVVASTMPSSTTTAPLAASPTSPPVSSDSDIEEVNASDWLCDDDCDTSGGEAGGGRGSLPSAEAAARQDEQKKEAKTTLFKQKSLTQASMGLSLMAKMSKLKIKALQVRQRTAASLVAQSSQQAVTVTDTVVRAEVGKKNKKGATKRLNQYTLGDDLGRGQFGKVKLATDDKGRQFAVKIMNKQRLGKVQMSSRSLHVHVSGMSAGGGEQGKDGECTPSTGVGGPGDNSTPPRGLKDGSTALDSVKTEIAIMKKLRHPNLVQLFEVIDDPEHHKLYLVLDLQVGVG